MKSSFTVIFTMVILMLIGMALLPLIDIGSQPRERQGKTLEVCFTWPNAAAHVVEQNVTSRIEGAVSSIRGVAGTSTESRYGRGRITVELKPEASPSAARFELASMLKQLSGKFPEGVSYPELTGGDVVSGEYDEGGQKLLMTYIVGSNMSPRQLKDWTRRYIEPVLLRNDEIRSVETVGGTDRYLDIIYDPIKLQTAGISASDIEEGIRAFIGREDIVGDVLYQSNNGRQRISLLLTTEAFRRPLEEMPVAVVKNDDGTVRKTVYLNDLASYEYRDRDPENYYRVNGLESVYLNIYVSARANMIRLSSMLRESLDQLKNDMPKGVSLELSYDGAEKEQGELYRLVTRSLVSLLILLIFVWIVNRSVKYLALVAVTLAADILISCIVYYVFDIRLHVFSLAGITVSLGLVIDASIVMIDHYCYYRDRRAFLAILAALLTTIGPLVLIHFMPDYIKRDLYDFAWIVFINLCTALIVALFFVPALVEKLRYFRSETVQSVGTRRKFVHFSVVYSGYIAFTQKRKWIWITLLILLFGFPVFLLPSDNATIARWKKPLSQWLGGTMNLFAESLKTNTFRHEECEMQLNIRGRMPLGGTATELDAKVRILEEYLLMEESIRRWETTVTGKGAEITVFFTPEALKSSAPYMVENRVIGKVIGIGGAEWSTYGVSQRGFSNSLHLQWRTSRIEISGYNYDRLYRYAEEVEKILQRNPRIQDIVIETPGFETQEDEYYVVYDLERIRLMDIDLYKLHEALAELLSSKNIGLYDDGRLKTEMQLTSFRIEDIDLWKLTNSFIMVDGRSIKLEDIMHIKRREARNVIPRKNQEYILRVAFNVLGTYTYADRYIKEVTGEVNGLMAPGYRCVNGSRDYYEDTGVQYWLLLIVIAVIFMVCAILFESLTSPLVIISLIPVSMIGIFLAFYFTGAPFGTGGFASMILLCGLVVNAGIYLLAEYDNIMERRKCQENEQSLIRLYIKAYNHKIIPILLTILSTVLGILPFLWDGKEEQFWFSFAVGTIGGLVFSIFALIFCLPVFMKMSKRIN